eukprot:scaffold440_cov277-Ochromonas_danica.AAC.9
MGRGVAVPPPTPHTLWCSCIVHVVHIISNTTSARIGLKWRNSSQTSVRRQKRHISSQSTTHTTHTTQ